MEFRLSKKSKYTLRMEVINPDDTIIYPLISQLLRDKRVTDARYIAGHPQLDKPTIFVKVKQGKPQEIVRDVALDLASRYGSMKEAVEESVGGGKSRKKAA